MPRRFHLILLPLLLASAAPAHAQQGLPLSEILPQLLGNTIVLGPTDLPDQPDHEAHFKPGADQLEVPGQFNRALLTLLSTYPVGTPSGGFTYTFDPALGTLPSHQRELRALVRGARPDDRPRPGQRRLRISARELRHVRRPEPARRDVKFYVPHLDCCSRGGGPTPEPDGSRLTPAVRGRPDRGEPWPRADHRHLGGLCDLWRHRSLRHRRRGALRASRAERQHPGAVERLATAQEEKRTPSKDRITTSRSTACRASPPGWATSWCARSMPSTTRARRPSAGLRDAAADGRRDEPARHGRRADASSYGIASMNRTPARAARERGLHVLEPGGAARRRAARRVNIAAGFDLAVSPRTTMAFDLLGRTLH